MNLGLGKELTFLEGSIRREGGKERRWVLGRSGMLPQY